MTGRQREAAAAAAVRECRAALAARGNTLISEATGAATGEIADWRHYPAGEAYDPASHAQYFYHRHPAAPTPAADQIGEHGHFHLFLRGQGVPAGIAPALNPEIAVANAPTHRATPQSAPLKRGACDEVCHLIAIALDRRGEPIRLFTTNRWVTGETWYRAEDAVRLLDRFVVRGDAPSALLNRWLGALVRLYREDIAELLAERDRAIIEWRWRHPGSAALEDPRIEITSHRAINLDARLAAIEQRASAPFATRRAPRLPRMAEGWGN